ncbi:MAG: hypothetical protein ACE5IY_22580 [bacterium]
MRSSIAFLLVLTLNITGCRHCVQIEDISAAPAVIAADTVFANVFTPLDGKWRGKFTVYVDERGQVVGTPQPRDIDEQFFRSLPLKVDLVVEVEQEYKSESPYFQRVTIRDAYVDQEGERTVSESRGVNKIQDGKMWCVVEKADETVIHAGELQGKRTIVWHRHLVDPLKLEYFKETVLETSYRILGWGYYGDDDPELSPRYWFEATYTRVEE